MVTIISSDMCPYCTMAKQLLDSLGVEYMIQDITGHPEKLRDIVLKTGMMTVPQVFIGEVSKENLLGGYDDIKALHDKGELLDKLS